jgi:hypothetical protein
MSLILCACHILYFIKQILLIFHPLMLIGLLKIICKISSDIFFAVRVELVLSLVLTGGSRLLNSLL